jgi:hypothetical protein
MAELLLNHGKGLFSSAGCVNEFDSFGLPLGEVAISLCNLLIKIEAKIFESIFLSYGAGAAESPAPCLGRIKVENQSEIGFAMGDRKAVDEIYFIHGEATGIALEDGGGVVKTVGDDPFASGQGRKDGLADEFGSARGKE